MRIWCTILCVFGFIQDFEHSFKTKDNSRLIFSNNLNQVYIVNSSELSCYSEKGNELYTFNDVSLGDISSLDVNLSLKPMLFYEEVQAIVFLDNTLSQQGETIYPVHHGYSNVTKVCHSADNNFWIFERDNFELIRINRQMQSIFKTGSLSLLLGRTIEPDYMLERKNLLYVKDPVKGIYVFDIYGNWVKTIPLNVKGKIEVYQDLIYFLEDGIVKKYDQKNFLDHSLEFSVEKLDDFSFQADRIFTLRKGVVKVLAKGLE